MSLNADKKKNFFFFKKKKSSSKSRIAPELLTVLDEPKSDWNEEKGYRSNVNASDSYPRRAFGLNNWFFSKLRFKFDGSELCNGVVPEFQVSLHLPDELPQFDNFVHVSLEQNVYLSIKPKMTITSEGLHDYTPQQRGCFFPSERQLHFFKSYSQPKCKLECLTNYTLNDCGCVRFWMPSK